MANNRITVARLADAEVLSLRARKAAGEVINVKAEADRFSCGTETIRKILRGDTFRHLLRDGSKQTCAAVPEPSEAEMMRAFSQFTAEVKAVEEEEALDIQALLAFHARNT